MLPTVLFFLPFGSASGFALSQKEGGRELFDFVLCRISKLIIFAWKNIPNKIGLGHWATLLNSNSFFSKLTPGRFPPLLLISANYISFVFVEASNAIGYNWKQKFGMLSTDNKN